MKKEIEFQLKKQYSSKEKTHWQTKQARLINKKAGRVFEETGWEFHEQKQQWKTQKIK